jgi:hypothetical protein
MREQKDARPRVDALTAPTSNSSHSTTTSRFTHVLFPVLLIEVIMLSDKLMRDRICNGVRREGLR